MERYEGRSPLKEAMDRINAKEKRDRIINKTLNILSIIISLTAITISLFK